MRESLVIEVRDSAGRVRERTRVTELPCRIGRAYSNVVILDDPYVSKEHLEIVRIENGQISIRDLGTENGTLRLSDRSKIGETTVSSGTALSIGDSTVQLYVSSHEVPATIPLHRSDGKIDVQLRRPVVAFLFLALYLAAGFSWHYWFNSAPDATDVWLRTFIARSLITIALLIPWVGFWGIISGINLHRSNFAAHLTSVVIALFAGNIAYIICDYSYFSFASLKLSTILLAISSLLLLGWLLAMHLRFATLKSRKTIRQIAGTISLVFVAMIGLGLYLENTSFSSDIPYSPSLKPPAFKLVRSVSIDAFFVGSERLKEGLDKEAGKGQTDQDESR